MEKEGFYYLEQEKPSIDKLAQMVVEHTTNSNGERLALIWESASFRHIWDPKGVHQRNHHLQRKCQQVFNQYNADTHTFQKIYYHRDLTAADELTLREVYQGKKKTLDNMNWMANAGLFAAYWPLTYHLSARARPYAVGAWTLFYYFGVV